MEKKASHRQYLRFKRGALIEFMLVDVFDDRVVQQVFDGETTGDESPGEG